MTRKQIEEAKNSLPRFNNRTYEEKHIADELSCREMINSCLIYCNQLHFTMKQRMSFNIML